MTCAEWAERIYPVLIGRAHHRQTINYTELKQLIGFEGLPHRLSNPLGRIASCCHGNGWPILPALVINQTGEPGLGIPFVADALDERQRVFAFDWYKQRPVRPDDFLQPACLPGASPEDTPPSLRRADRLGVPFRRLDPTVFAPGRSSCRRRTSAEAGDPSAFRSAGWATSPSEASSRAADPSAWPVTATGGNGSAAIGLVGDHQSANANIVTAPFARPGENGDTRPAPSGQKTWAPPSALRAAILWRDAGGRPTFCPGPWVKCRLQTTAGSGSIVPEGDRILRNGGRAVHPSPPMTCGTFLEGIRRQATYLEQIGRPDVVCGRYQDGHLQLCFSTERMPPHARERLRAESPTTFNQVLGLWFRGEIAARGPKVFRPTAERCLALEHIAPRVPLDWYRQPYPVMLVEFPEAYRRRRACRAQNFFHVGDHTPEFCLSAHRPAINPPWSSTSSLVRATCTTTSSGRPRPR